MNLSGSTYLLSNQKALLDILGSVSNFHHESRKILSQVETSAERVITIEEAYKKLTALNLRQDELIRESLRCIETGLFRAAHVMSWSAMSDFIASKLASHTNKSLDDVREQFNDHRIIEQLRVRGLITKSLEKALKGLLNKRDECSHPSDYFPELDQTLGFVREVLERLSTLIKRFD